jgi:hypothetical protein
MKSIVRQITHHQSKAWLLALAGGLLASAVSAQTQPAASPDPFVRPSAQTSFPIDTDSLVANLKPGSPAALVAARANKRWEHMVKHDFKAVHGFFTPYNKTITTQEAYVKEMGKGNAWLGAEVVSVSCKPQLCNATIRIDVASPMPGKFGDKITTHVDEEWVLVDGEWWFSRR